jgi:hypothetical protein
MELAGSQAKAAVRVAAPRTLPRAPSWGRVLATTISLWTRRRVARLRHPRLTLFLTICVVVAAATVVSVVQFTGTSPRTAPPARPHQVRPAWAAGAAGAVRGQAAAWVADQVSSAEMVGCDPLMCAALHAHGVAASRLVPAGTGASGATGAGVLVASVVSDDLQGTPVLLARFGSGGNVVEVRAAAAGGTAAYQRAVQADQAARRSAGTQLLHSRRVQVGDQAAGQLEAGEVDTRLLIMLAMLASQHPWRVVAFGGASPGVPFAQAPFRQVTITGPDGGALASSLALVRAQRAPYQPAQAAIVRLPGGPAAPHSQLAQGQLALRIEFAAPSPPGLLTGGAAG